MNDFDRLLLYMLPLAGFYAVHFTLDIVGYVVGYYILFIFCIDPALRKILVGEGLIKEEYIYGTVVSTGERRKRRLRIVRPG